jgi:hypothetical protein
MWQSDSELLWIPCLTRERKFSFVWYLHSPLSHATTVILTQVLLPRDVKRIISILLLLLASTWLSASGGNSHAQIGIVHTYSATPTSRAKTYPCDERRDSQRRRKKDDAFKKSVPRQRIRVRHNPLESVSCCKLAPGVQIDLIGFPLSHAGSLSAGCVPSLVRKRGPPGL